VLWVGTDDGNLWISLDNGSHWQKLNDRLPDNPAYWITRVVASHHYAGTAYVAISGLRRDDFRPYLYKTTDFGQTWTSLAENLPLEPINVVVEDNKNPNLLFVGTMRAVYVSIDGGRSWAKMQNNMPTIPVYDLVIHPRENDLVVGTHGRGFYITDISPLQELMPEVLTKEVHLFEIEPKVQWKIISQHTRSAQNFAGENEPRGVIINYYLKNKVKGEVKITVFDGAKVLQELSLMELKCSRSWMDPIILVSTELFGLLLGKKNGRQKKRKDLKRQEESLLILKENGVRNILITMTSLNGMAVKILKLVSMVSP